VGAASDVTGPQGRLRSTLSPRGRTALRPVLADDLRRRFFATVKDFSHKFIVRFTRVDYAKAKAFITLDQATGEMLGVARLHSTTDRHCGEFAILVRSDLKNHGLGWQLMQMNIAYADKGIPLH
jgi:hypothetical protein